VCAPMRRAAPPRFESRGVGYGGGDVHGRTARRRTLRDRFEGALDRGWTFIREAPERHRIRDGGFEIRAEPGDANSVKNALVRPAPDRRKGVSPSR